MELTQATVNDLLDRLGPGAGHLYLPGDLDPQALADLLGGRYGAPRTLVLDGFTDPTARRAQGRGAAGPVRGPGRHGTGVGVRGPVDRHGYGAGRGGDRAAGTGGRSPGGARALGGGSG
ncbi:MULTISPECIES: hypothetical protein [Streptomyces]|uniref:hypothetical protein n=1 Tax=Streptomyces TaxID=1883 RepID=UPI00183D1A55|nr:hypothetical protein [Streptomyces murinus]MBA9048671.1 hypothetical protein [Streptomyces murinus]